MIDPSAAAAVGLTSKQPAYAKGAKAYMNLTSAQANKLLRRLREERDLIAAREEGARPKPNRRRYYHGKPKPKAGE